MKIVGSGKVEFLINILIRGFNDHINSKTGQELPPGQKRGTKDWLVFQDILIDCLRSLGHRVECYEEHPILPPMPTLFSIDKRIVVHKCKRDEDFDLTFMQMHMRELFTIDTNGWGADHSENNFQLGEVDAEEAKEFCQEHSSKLMESGESKCIQEKNTSDTPGSFILVPLQIPRDYTIKHHSPTTVKYFIDSLMSWAEETRTHICIKMHPFNKVDTDLQMAVSEGESRSDYVHKVEGNIHELIRRSVGLFVINSGTGFEALLHGRPVATFGNCDYNRVTFNADLRRLNEARDFLLAYRDEERNLAYGFVWWYWHVHAYDVNREDTKERLTEYLRSNL